MTKHVTVSLTLTILCTCLYKGISTYERHGMNSIEMNDSLETINLMSRTFRVINVHRCIYFKHIALVDA